MFSITKTSGLTRAICADALPAALAITIGMAPAAFAAGTSEIALVATLDEPRGHCCFDGSPSCGRVT